MDTVIIENNIENNPIFHERITTATSSAAVARGSLDQSNGNEDEDGDENETDEEPEDDVVQELIDFIPVEDREKITDESTIIELIKEQHSGPIGGHRGINATVKVIKLLVCQRTLHPNENSKIEPRYSF